MLRKLSVIALLSVLQLTCGDYIHEPGRCMLYDQCGYNTDLTNYEVRGEMGCVNNIIAKQINDRFNRAHLDLYKRVCPMMVDENAEEAELCCNQAQLRTLNRQLVASALIFARCPSCYYNFVSLYCHLTCSPDQSTYVNVTRTFTNPNASGPGSAEQDVIIAETTAVGMHSSCKDVTFSQTNGKAITLVCNGFTGESCTPQAMLDYLGSTGNGVAPVDMVFLQVGSGTNVNNPSVPNPPDGLGVMNFSTPACNVSPDNQSETCSCSDCDLSCPAPPPTKEPVTPFMIGNADGSGVIILIIFLVLSVFFLIYAVVVHMLERKKKSPSSRPPLKSTASTAKMMNWSDSESINSSSTNSCFDDDLNAPIVSEFEISKFERIGKASQDFFRKIFKWWGVFVATHPLWIIVSTLVIIIALCVGMKFIILTTDPVDLWTSETSTIRQEKTYFDNHFGAFYRTEMVIMKLKEKYQRPSTAYTSYTGSKHNFSEILQTKYILELLELQDKIRYSEVLYDDDNGEQKIGKLSDICFKPLEPANNNCTITSVANYWQSDPNELLRTKNWTDKITNNEYVVDYRDHFLYCVQSPATLQDTTPLTQNCMGDFGGPVFAFLAVGGQGEDAPYNEAEALILTFVINNYPKGDIRSVLTKAWEKNFLEIMQNWNSEYFDYAFFSERSPEEELERSSETDLVVFLASYIVIFVYITIALGTYTSIRRIPIDSKVSLGLAGILVILASVLSSIGFLGYVGYSTSLIVIEVVPFLVLAIGADNIFILTLEYQRMKRLPEESLPEHIGRAFAEVAPSMLLCSLTECVTFFLGTLTDMPAIEEFAFAAALAILFDFLFQITLFLAVLSLDARRQESNRFDICCCISSESQSKPTKSFLEMFFKKYYAPFLMNDIVRSIVMVGFTALCCWCTYLSCNMTIGLDQDLSVPKDSYVLKYFDYMEKYLDVGVPVYFVTKSPYNFSNENASKYVCASAGCDDFSMVQQITYASQNPDYWKIETPAASWYDDYIDWLTPAGQRSCCRYSNVNGSKTFCPATSEENCIPCLTYGSDYTDEQFMEYLPWFLIDNPGLECNKGGHSAYGNAVNITENYQETNKSVVEASYFMAYHSVCIKSVDCTANLIKGKELAANITATLKAANANSSGNIIGNEEDFEVFPYCLYYVFYEQYLTMVEDTLFSIGICLIPTFIFSFILLGFDLFSGLITVVTIVMIVVDTAGLSSLWGVHLNAVSLINLIQAIGLSVEFISHVVHTFSTKTNLSRKERVIESMGTMGPAVFAGVALTNLPGIIVLNWATAQLIQIFFFRMCLIITLLGMVHGLIFLPVFLSYFGPSVNKALLREKQLKQLQKKQKREISNPGFKDTSDEVTMKDQEKKEAIDSEESENSSEHVYVEPNVREKENTYATAL